MRFILFLFICMVVIILTACGNSIAYVVPEDFDNAGLACKDHKGWFFFEKDVMHGHKAPIRVYCKDDVTILYMPKQGDYSTKDVS